MINKRCKGCGKIITTNNTIYCDFNCRKFGKKVVCQNCKKEIYCNKKQLKSKYHYCSRKCYVELRKKDKTVCTNYGNFKQKIFYCLNCNKKNSIHKKSKRLFCNQKCWTEYINKYPETASNFKGGKLIKCCICGNKKWFIPYYHKLKKFYCSKKCYHSDKTSGHIKMVINHNKKYGCVVGKNEKTMLDYLSNKFNVKILRNQNFGRIRVDGYIPQSNTIIEIDEPYHKYRKEKDKIRDDKLKQLYGCKIIRIDSWETEVLENVNL